MKIAIISGSNRASSSSKLLAKYVGSKLEEKGCEVTFHDLFEKPVPFYYPDERDQVDDVNLQLLAKTVAEADGIVLSSPEYHGGPTGVLKNALDHLDSEHFDGKIVLVMSSAGGAVGVSTLQQLQVIVRNVHGINCPEWISIGGDQRRFTSEGEPESELIKKRVARTLQYFVTMIVNFRK
ncbi:NAD(P)H-dependent oxidoreductase [Paenibacillus sp. GP183]|uniref:NADPH-dependent FMN reductase n=1 Tax=Paenibacillus sp. GP183 TaxID=1882751 RepID=UPI000898F38A|nr:NAD(P)H-dependent oxidoreductase [Paenibacillus sp. GP183]SEB77053.1 azobenzene reductase [Paenibacillus sp. GP183]